MKLFRLRVVLALTMLAIFAAAPALAHKASDAYVTLNGDPDNGHLLHGQWDIALRDLDHAIGLDTNGDGAITWGEVQARQAAIADYALSHLTIRSDGIVCPVTQTGRQMIDAHSDGAYNVLYFTVNCDKEVPNKLSVDYSLFFAIDPSHRGIITVHHDGATTNTVLSPGNPKVTLNLNEPDRWRQFENFVVDGIWHIWTGYDHLLFVLSLLLPAVLVRRRRSSPWEAQRGSVSLAPATPATDGWEWEAAPSLWMAFVDIFKIISGFTISHTFTLTLAVLGIVTIPSRIVESGIALSVILAAANNLYPMVHKRLWLVAFGFGFIHGLGFASALTGLQLPPAAMAASLGGFNVGVEIGQEAVVLALMPFAYLMRYSRFYRVFVLKAGSAIIVLIALGWLIQRAFGILIPVFSVLLPK
ncbi:MAG TPA: HupE/UreJ family protein [Gammaproteobacteria bacterium]|nr:HupE/UreJ family protein [Gammaproteobacteria bacterium]